MKNTERKNFLSGLEVFNREELAALLLTCFGQAQFPPADAIHPVALEKSLITEKTTVLQMAKEFQKNLDAPTMLSVYSHLYAISQDTGTKRKAKSRKKA